MLCHIFEKYIQFSAYIIQMLRYDGCLRLYLTLLIINISFFPKNLKLKYARGLGQWQLWTVVNIITYAVGRMHLPNATASYVATNFGGPS